ncbi:MAG TPA: PilZ domain-containing protein [Gemmatimonadaceae bacterium]|nr:PilZ domain-containing protein [Gemmatimonadaceae bacterium]
MKGEKLPDPNDLRHAPRYRVDAPVEFIVGNGVARDLSTTGLYFICEKPLQVGYQLTLTIQLDDTVADMPVKMECKGTIVRVEDMDGRIGVAVKLDQPK